MNEKEADKFNDEFRDFCLNHGIKSSIAYFYIPSSNKVAFALHNASDEEIMNVVANLVHHLASKNNLRSSDIWQQLQQSSPEYIPDYDLM